jgi:hypothetical protein
MNMASTVALFDVLLRQPSTVFTQNRAFHKRPKFLAFGSPFLSLSPARKNESRWLEQAPEQEGKRIGGGCQKDGANNDK